VSERLADESNAVGLCARCCHVRLIRSDRGAIFYSCQQSETDARFSKYPRLPVLSCSGYEEKESERARS